MNYLIFRASDNRLIRSGACIAARFDQQAQKGEYAVENLDAFPLVPVAGQSYSYDPATGGITAGDDLAAARGARIEMLTQACSVAILAGFMSSALGSPATYPAADTDQANMQRAALAGGSLWCMDDANNWTLAAHSAVQATQVLKDFGVACDAARANLADKLAAVAAAQTVAAVNAVDW